ncbi:hypothetical protein R1flu_010227 [Riccia fluitans]|uniref:Uncharacterized protein n=1 Tax=Riccia fluitans TaxID=41844 RepID=A0ABD1Z4J9_9MARC
MGAGKCIASTLGMLRGRRLPLLLPRNTAAVVKSGERKLRSLQIEWTSIRANYLTMFLSASTPTLQSEEERAGSSVVVKTVAGAAARTKFTSGRGSAMLKFICSQLPHATFLQGHDLTRHAMSDLDAALDAETDG